jgi:hypothetical protein
LKWLLIRLYSNFGAQIAAVTSVAMRIVPLVEDIFIGMSEDCPDEKNFGDEYTVSHYFY